MTSFDLNHLFKASISKYIHIRSYWELELQHINLGQGHNSVHYRLQYTTLCPVLLLGLGNQERHKTEGLL